MTVNHTRLTVQFERNESHPKGPAYVELGPYEWVQVTYDTLRISPNGDEIADYEGGSGGYWVTKDGESWSDFIIAPSLKPTCARCGEMVTEGWVGKDGLWRHPDCEES